VSKDHGSCEKCGLDLNGDLIWEYFYSLNGDEAESDRISAQYGATRESGRWGKAIAIYSAEKDRTVSFKCPNCGHQWKRE
jgi:hypothetical protein